MKKEEKKAEEYFQDAWNIAFNAGMEEERIAWINGRRCTNCGDIKERDLADMCGKCFEEA